MKIFKMPSSPIKMVMLIIATLMIVIAIWNSFSLNFTLLGILAIFIFGMSLALESMASKFSLFNHRSLVATVLLGVFGILCILTLCNYLYPPQTIFSALDHHALKLKGISINHPQGFVLAGNDDRAFFDNPEMEGTLSIVDTIGDSAVIIRGQGFTRPIYLASYDDKELNNRLEVRNVSHYISFDSAASVSFVSHAGIVRTLTLHEKHKDGHWPISHPKDSTIYIWNGDTASERRFIKQSLPLQDIAASTFNPLLIDSISTDELNDSICLAGINLLRPIIDIQVLEKDRFKKSSHSYLLEFQHSAFDSDEVNSDMIIDEVRVNGHIYSVRNMLSATWYDTIPMGKKGTWVIGSGADKTRHVYFEKKNGELQLLFRMPIYQHLSVQDDSPNTTSLLATSIETVEHSLPENVVLFDIFNRPMNQNNLGSGYFLSYADAPTTTQIHFTLTSRDDAQDMINFTPNEPIKGLVSANGRVRYLMEVQDFSTTTPFHAHQLLLYLLLIIIGLMLILNLGRMSVNEGKFFISNDDDNKAFGTATHRGTLLAGYSPYTDAEFFAYLFVLFFLTIRFFLLWRTSVFPPISIKSAGYFYMWQNPNNLKVTLECLSLFILLAVFKSFFGKWGVRQLDRTKEMMIRWTSKWKIFIWTCVLWIAAFCIVATSSRSGWVLLECVGIYFIVQAIISVSLSPLLTDAPLSVFLLSLLNGLLISAALIVYDSGYGIVFLSFIISWTVYDLWFCFVSGSRMKHYKIIAVCLLVLFVGLVAVFYSYKQVILFYYSYPVLSALIGGLLVLGFIIALHYVLGLGRASDDSLRRFFKGRISLSTLLMLLIPILFGVVIWGLHGSFFKDHTKQRVLVHIKSRYDILSSDIHSQADENRFMDASLNDWTLQQYINKGEDVHLAPGHNTDSYFKLQPHSQVGALWGAQATDISLARFIIAEHSGHLAVIMVALALVLLLVSLSLMRIHRTCSNLIVQIPLLLFVQMLLVWMANTGRFIFFGQDFPMVSITSSFSQAYFFGLLFAWLFVVIWETCFCRSVGHNLINVGDDEKMFTSIHDLENRFHSIAVSSGFSIVIVFFIYGLLSFINQNSGSENIDENNPTAVDKKTAPQSSKSIIDAERENTLFTFAKIYEVAENKIDLINDIFFDYQDSLSRPIRLKSNMAPDIQKFYREKEPEINAILNGNNPNQTDRYTRRLWDNFISYGARDNSPKSAIHVRGSREPFRTGGKRGRKLMLALKSGFMDVKLPDGSKEKWHGNVIEESRRFDAQDTLNRVLISRSQGVRCYHLPASWTEDHSIVHLAKLDGGRQELEIENCPKRIASSGPYSSFRLYTYDIAQDNRLVSNLMGGTSFVFAKAVRINNNQVFVYPLKEKFYWASYFAGMIQKKMKDTPMDSLAKDMPITINAELTETLYDNLRTTRGSRCVVVADGAGNVKAIVDHKSQRYTLNPNRRNNIEELMEQLYLENNPVKSDKYFATVAMSRLKNGPGSSQKPLVWTAVASGLDWNRLPDLQLIAASQQPGNSPYSKGWYVGQDFYIKHPLLSSSSDESGGTISIGIRNYMEWSSNFYNAMMCYLGSLDASLYQQPGFLNGFQTGNDTQLLRPATQLDLSNPRQYPIVQLGDQRYVFTQTLTANGVRNGLLATNMSEMFGLGTSYTDVPQSVMHIPRYPGINVSESDFHLEPSALMMEQRAAENSKERLDYAIRATAVGAKVWEVTPFKMAEMFGRLASMNQNYTLTFSSESTPKYQMWQPVNSSYWRGRQQLLQGMHDVFINGTARSAKLGQISNYHLYGKTGTIGEKGVNDHRLAVIIANCDLANIRTPEELSQVHYYVVYFALDYGADWGCYERCVRAIINSTAFRQYMSQS